MKTSEEIWLEYHVKLSGFIKSRVDEDLVDDLIQDVFIRIHAGITSLKDKDKLESWLYQITRNTIIDYYRSKRITEELPDWLVEPQAEEEHVIREELSSCLGPMISELPEKYRRAVQMSELDNKTQKEVANIEGISLSGAKSRVQRGRAMLKNMMQECCQFELNCDNQIVSYAKKEQDCKFC